MHLEAVRDLQAQRLTHKILSGDEAFASRSALAPAVRMFALMPLEHSEDLGNHKTMVQCMSVVSVSSLFSFPAPCYTQGFTRWRAVCCTRATTFVPPHAFVCRLAPLPARL